MLNKSRFLSTSAAVFTLLSMPHAAMAQIAQAQTSTAPATPERAAIGDIIVTAQKRGENINSVPLAITAATGDQLIQKGVVSVGDLTKIEPSLQLTQSQSGTPVFTLRGVGYFEQSLSATPTVSIYQDEVPFAFPSLSRGVILDPERVEILKGPQGTLYGQNATGGAVNFIAAKPTKTLKVGGDLSYGRFDEVIGSAFISGPVSPTIGMRLSGRVESGGAWQRSVTRPGDKLGDKNSKMVRLITDWSPSDNFKASLNLNAWWDKSETQAGQLLGFRFQAPQNVGAGNVSNPGFYLPAAPGTAAFAGYPGVVQTLLQQPISGGNARDADWLIGTRPRNNQKFYQAALRMDYDFSDAIGITSLTSYIDFDQDNLIDPTGNGLIQNQTARIDGRVKSFFQEIRLHGRFGTGGNWMIGANYSRDKSAEVDTVTTVGSVSFAPVALGLPPYFNFGAINRDTAVTKSIYANLEYELTPTLTARGGIRYTKSKQTIDGCSTSTDFSVNALQAAVSQLLASQFGNPGGSNAIGECTTLGPPPFFLPGNIRNTLNEDNIPWRVGLDWKPIERTLLYASVSKGYKAGSSPALGASNFNQLTPVTQEALLAYEVGVKSELFNRTVQVTAAAFHYDYTNKQQLGRLQDPVYGAVQTLLNIPKSKLDGVEASITWRPTEGLTLNTAATYLKSKVQSDFFNTGPYPLGPADAINFRGERFPFTPEWSVQFGGRYDFDLNAGLKAFVAADGSYQSFTSAAFGYRQAGITGAPSLVIPGYALFNLSAGIGDQDERWRAEVFGRNVTNKYYLTSINYIADSVTGFTGRPATYGVRLSFRY